MRVEKVTTKKQVFDLHPLGEDMYREAAERFSDWRYSSDKVWLKGCDSLRPDSMNFLAGIWTDDDIPVGAMLGYVTPMWFSDDLVACDYALYVRAEYRGAHATAVAVRRVVRLFEDWARGKGAKRVSVGVTAGIADKSAVALYRALGFGFFGEVLSKSLV